MMKANDAQIFIDPAIPMEQQIAFLRQGSLNFQFAVLEVLKEKFGDEGVAIFKSMWRQVVSQGLDRITDKSFEEIKKFAGRQDRMFGFQIEQVSTKPDELQYFITCCPYLEESKRRGTGIDLCNIIEEVEMEEVGKRLGEMTEPTRMCRGDSKCTVRIRNTLGR